MDVEPVSLASAMADSRLARGMSHDFYPYPARMSPFVARHLIQALSEPRDWVLDPFMGSGTSIVEALAAGRRAAGSDISPLSHLLTSARTQPLSLADVRELREWIDDGGVTTNDVPLGDWDSLPHGKALSLLASTAAGLSFARRKSAARACLLSLGKWLMDEPGAELEPDDLRARLHRTLNRLIAGTEELIEAATRNELSRRKLPTSRILAVHDATELTSRQAFRPLLGKVKLIVTSPPYPAVHVLYHRWQIRSRRETAAPFWIAGAQDGRGPAYYTMGGRGTMAEARYFSLIESAFRELREFLTQDGRLCLLVALPHFDRQMPLMQQAAESAGLRPGEIEPVSRFVPNRKWYARRQTTSGAAEETLIVLQREETVRTPKLSRRLANA